MDIEGLRKLVNDWYSKQGVTDGIRVIITVDIKGCNTTTEPAKVLTMVNFLSEEFFKPLGMAKRSGSLVRLVNFVYNKGYVHLTVSEFVSIPNIAGELRRTQNLGSKSIQLLNDALVFHGFKPIT